MIFRSIGVRAHWAVYLLALLAAGAAFTAAWLDRQDRLWAGMQGAAYDAAREVGLSTRSARDSVYMLQGVANGLFQQQGIELSPEHWSGLAERLDLPGTTVMLPMRNAAHRLARYARNNHFDSPAFSMAGPKPAAKSDIGREIEIALTLGPALMRAKMTQAAAASVYYLSGRGFHLIFPPASDDLQLFTPDMLASPTYLSGLLDRNADRTPAWSPAYDDPKGNGLISTLSIPVDDDDGNFRGVAAMDFQLDSLSQFVRRPALGIATGFIMDEHDAVIAHPTLLGGASDHAPTLADVARLAGSAGDWTALRTAPSNNRQVLGDELALVYDIEATPWRYVITVNRKQLSWTALRSMPVEAAGLIALLLVLTFAEKRRRDAVVSLRRKAAEEVLQAAPAPVAVLRQTDLSVALANAALLRLFTANGPTDELQPVTVSVAHEQLQALIRTLSSQQRIQPDALTEMSLQRADGQAFWVLVRCVAVVHEERPAWLCSLTDVTALKEAKDQLETLATTDPLTGALNRRAVATRGTVELRRANRNAVSFASLLLDIDHFKVVNDTHGHSTGDRVLQAVASACQGVLRDVDVFGRWGGEEFIALLPDTDLAGATAAAERMRLAIQALVLTSDEGAPIHITASVGVSVWMDVGDTLEALLMRGDAALYQAKGAGRNRVCVAPRVIGSGALPAAHLQESASSGA